LTPDTDGDGWTNGEERLSGTYPAQSGDNLGVPNLTNPPKIFFDKNDTSVDISVSNSGGPAIDGITITTPPGGGAVTTTGGTGFSDTSITFTWNSTGFTGLTTTLIFRADNPSGNDTATVTLEMNIDAVDDVANVNEGSSVLVDVLANDKFGGSVTIAPITMPSDGMAVEESGQIRYTPDPLFVGPSDSFMYTITDGAGKMDTATVDIAVAATKPIPSDDLFTDAGLGGFFETDPTPFALDVINNDVGVAATSVTITTPPPVGDGTAVVDADGTTINFTPSATFFSGTTTLRYESAANGNTSNNTALVTIEVIAVIVGTQPDNFDVEIGTPGALDITANDTLGGTPVSITIVDSPSNGTLTNTNTLIPTYTPDPGFLGPTDTFTYTVTNPAGTSSPKETVTINIGFQSLVGGSAIRNGTDDPALFPVAGSLDDVCVDLNDIFLNSGSDLSALTEDQADLFTNCLVLSAEATNGNPIDGPLDAINNKHAFAASETAIRIAQTGINNINERLAHVRGGRRGRVQRQRTEGRLQTNSSPHGPGRQPAG